VLDRADIVGPYIYYEICVIKNVSFEEKKKKNKNKNYSSSLTYIFLSLGSFDVYAIQRDRFDFTRETDKFEIFAVTNSTVVLWKQGQKSSYPQMIKYY
jgi:hypothetical protein